MSLPTGLRLPLRFLYRLQLKTGSWFANLGYLSSYKGRSGEGRPVLVYIGGPNQLSTFVPVVEHLKGENLIIVGFHKKFQERMKARGLSFLKGEGFIPFGSLAAEEFLIPTLRGLVRRFNPSLVVAMNTAFDEFIGEFETPSLLIRHGLLINQLDQIPKIENSHVACVGEHDRDLLNEGMGVPQERLHVTGLPRFDSLSSTSFQKEELVKKYGLDPDSRHILIVTQPHDQPWEWSEKENRNFLEALFRAGLSLRDEGEAVQLLIKTHPREDPGFHREIAEGLGSDVRILPHADCSFQELTFLSDVVVTAFSTGGLEALLMGKPLVTICLSRERELIPFHEKGGSLGVFKEEELLPTLERALAGERGADVEGFLTHMFHLRDGKASQRTAKLIRTLQAGEGDDRG